MRQRAAASEKVVMLSEIFTSFEGEGILFGTKTLFVRLAGCPLKCHWCDTPYAIPMFSGEQRTLEEVKSLISSDLKKNTYKVNFTGGEPLAQFEAVIELAKFVKDQKHVKTYLESACYDSTRFEKVLPFIDICKIEFKLRDSRVVEDRHYPNLLRNELECLKLSIINNKIAYIKVVVTNSSSPKEFKDLVQKVFNIAKASEIAGFIIQPSHSADEPTLDRLFGFYDEVYPFYDQVRIVPQMHKSLGVR